MTTPDLVAENLRLQEELDLANKYKASLIEQLKHVTDYLTDVAADLSTPVPADAPVACRGGEHTEVAEIPGKCALCGIELPSGSRRTS